MSKRVLSLILCLVMCMGLLPMSVLAAEDVPAGHTHNEDGWTCHQDEVGRDLICGLEESEDHQHSEACFEVTYEWHCEAPAEEPAEEPSEEPAEEPTEEPETREPAAEEPAQEPEVQAPAEEPAEEPAEAPAAEVDADVQAFLDYVDAYRALVEDEDGEGADYMEILETGTAMFEALEAAGKLDEAVVEAFMFLQGDSEMSTFASYNQLLLNDTERGIQVIWRDGSGTKKHITVNMYVREEGGKKFLGTVETDVPWSSSRLYIVSDDYGLDEMKFGKAFNYNGGFYAPGGFYTVQLTNTSKKDKMDLVLMKNRFDVEVDGANVGDFGIFTWKKTAA